MERQPSLDNIVIVLQRPQKLVNIAGVVRAMKNMGLARLRLVRPAEYDARDIEGIAHRSADVRDAVTIHDTLDAALADAVFVVGTTSRPREGGVPAASPRALAPELLARAEHGPIALVFGPEDNGLTNAELDRCHRTLAIPTDPAYPSLNLAQAALLVAYELRLAAEQPAARQHAGMPSPAGAAQLEALFSALEQALWAIEFFKSGSAERSMRTLRRLIQRAEPNTQEAALMRAMALETINFLRRKGIEPAALKAGAAGAADDLSSGAQDELAG
jgi:TrmH family RNA methyltransferase